MRSVWFVAVALIKIEFDWAIGFNVFLAFDWFDLARFAPVIIRSFIATLFLFAKGKFFAVNTVTTIDWFFLGTFAALSGNNRATAGFNFVEEFVSSCFDGFVVFSLGKGADVPVGVVNGN